MPFCNFIANISRLEQDIVNRKMALQIAITHMPTGVLWSTNGKK